MTAPNQAYTLVPIEPTLSDSLALLKKEIMLTLNCHAVGTIQSFTPNTVGGAGGAPTLWGQTAKATINYPQTFFQFNASTRTYNPVQVNYPILIDAPCIVLGGGKASLTFPISPGDECLILFNDRDMNNWFQGGAGAPVASTRYHSLSDAIILVGLRSSGSVLQNYDPIRAVLQAGMAKVGVNPTNNEVLITNGQNSLGTLLQNLLTQLNNLTTQIAAITVTGVTTGMGASGPPANATAISQIGTQISQIASQLGELLE